ncbi:MAG: hypothetical protein QM783_10055 [Phycisphaerales bacterium]
MRCAASVLTSIAVCAVAAGGAHAPEPGLFELPTGKPSAATVTVGDKAAPVKPAGPDATSPMLLNLEGSLAMLTQAQVTQLADAIRGGRTVQLTPEYKRIGVVHLNDRNGNVAKRVELLVGPAASIIAHEFTDESRAKSPAGGPLPLAQQFDAEKFRKLSASWNLYRGSLEEGAGGLASQGVTAIASSAGTKTNKIELPAPALIYLDERTFSDRFLAGGTARPLKPVRVLSEEKFFLRPPTGYTPRRPVGLLVWINASREGPPPEVFSKALDELGIACVGIENAGNDRPVVDRFQLALDAFFAASEQIHVDPRRVYVTGISGGGRTCTRLACCFPDYFTGAVPIVGLSAYFDVPLGNGKHSPAGFDRPNSARFTLLRSRRIGAITGDKDFNHDEMAAIVERFTKDKVQARLFDHAGFGHQMPSPDQFVEAIKWVDEPYQDVVKKETAAAQALLDAYTAKHGEQPPVSTDAKARAELAKVTQTAPWTEPASRAARLLRGTSPAASTTDTR